MYPSSFDYKRATSVAEAAAMLKSNPGAKLLAGGHSLIPLLKLRLAAPSMLVDIGRIGELRGISSAAGVLRIGALTTHAELAESPVAAVCAPWISRSVTPLMAETTTTARSHTTSCSRVISASAAIAVAFPTDVPPNFMTKSDIFISFHTLSHRAMASSSTDER